MKVVRDLRVWIIRRRLRSAMVDLRSARTKLEKTKLMTTAFLKKYDDGVFRCRCTHPTSFFCPTSFTPDYLAYLECICFQTSLSMLF